MHNTRRLVQYLVLDISGVLGVFILHWIYPKDDWSF
jgi:hypothetical protein